MESRVKLLVMTCLLLSSANYALTRSIRVIGPYFPAFQPGLTLPGVSGADPERLPSLKDEDMASLPTSPSSAKAQLNPESIYLPSPLSGPRFLEPFWYEQPLVPQEKESMIRKSRHCQCGPKSWFCCIR
ncbi:hypothetical protein RvY_15169 [Ramazzottius varieornatus]|uniref:Uncharacterized protein n=1 Tax=Ramazzottius varieornatus TaxID=947166 RepID=A0A1D1VTX9_RAMVA|nr:hypothetical protein RvY_15169 [Ramazzottius varieornatus]